MSSGSPASNLPDIERRRLRALANGDVAAAAEAANHAAKDRVSHSGHGRENRARGDELVANRKWRGEHFV